jgi:porin
MNKSQWMLKVSLLCSFCITANAATPSITTTPEIKHVSDTISSNPAAVNINVGTGAVQRYIEDKLGIKNDHGIKLGGAWLVDTNKLLSGGIPHPKAWTSNSSLTLGLTADTQQLIGWQGGLFGAQFLQANDQATNAQAGTVQGYNSLPGPKPLNRSELYQLWYRQAFFNDRLFIRLGKSAPTYNFNNVVKPDPLSNDNISISAVSGLIYTPIFVNASMLGVLPGYYNSAYGITINYVPIKQWYASYGVYDGNLANGIQTGTRPLPTLNGSYFHIAETGLAWLLGKNKMPGDIGAGLWHQAGSIKGPVHENSATGFYLFGTQRLWYRHPGTDDSGISSFYQYGIHNSSALPVKEYIGLGLTAFGLTPHRSDDSMGIGSAFSWLNQHSFKRRTELMLQAYYQAKIINGIYLEPVLSYIPTPGASPNHDASWAATLRAMLLF